MMNKLLFWSLLLSLLPLLSHSANGQEEKEKECEGYPPPPPGVISYTMKKIDPETGETIEKTVSAKCFGLVSRDQMGKKATVKAKPKPKLPPPQPKTITRYVDRPVIKRVRVPYRVYAPWSFSVGVGRGPSGGIRIDRNKDDFDVVEPRQIIGSLGVGYQFLYDFGVNVTYVSNETWLLEGTGYVDDPLRYLKELFKN